MSAIIHIFLLLLLWVGWTWLNHSEPSVPDSIEIELVTLDDVPDMNKNDALSDPMFQRQSGPDEEGEDAPKTVTDAAAPVIESIQSEEIQESQPAPQPQPVPQPIPLPQPMFLPNPMALNSPASPNSAAIANRAAPTLFGIHQQARLPKSGKGLGDRWLNAIKADLGPVDRLLTSLPNTRFPAAYVITIDAMGRVLSVGVAISSGNQSGDDAVLAHIRRSSPVPRPPPDVPTPARVTLEIDAP